MAKGNSSAGDGSVSCSAEQTGKIATPRDGLRRPSRSVASDGDAAKILEAQARALLKSLYRCEPRITQELACEIDRVSSSSEFGIARRLGLITVSKDGKWFKGIRTAPSDEAHALACAFHEIGLHAKALKT